MQFNLSNDRETIILSSSMREELSQMQKSIHRETVMLSSSLHEQDPQISKKDQDDEDDEEIRNQLEWNVIYQDQEGLDSQIEFFNGVNVEGLHLMILNDSEQVFYPIIQAQIETFQFINDNQSQKTQGQTEFTLMTSYFNNRIDVWEPLLERTTLRITLIQDFNSSKIAINFKQPVNLNITEELIENLASAYKTLQRTQKAQQKFKQEQAEESNLRRTSIMRTVNNNDQIRQTQTERYEKLSEVKISKKQQLQQKQKILPNQKHCNLEFKVTPFRIENLTTFSFKIIRKQTEFDQQKYQKDVSKVSRGGRQVHQGQLKGQEKRLIPLSYIIDSRQSIDYEVDYEEESKKLMLSSKQDLVHKHYFIDIIPQGQSEPPEKLIDVDLAYIEPITYSFSSQPYDYIVFGREQNQKIIQKKIFSLRSPFIIFNKTNVNFVIKICAKKAKYLSNDDLIIIIPSGDCYPLQIDQLDKQIVFSTIEDYQQMMDATDLNFATAIWSQHFKISNFYNKSGIQMKKFTVYHNKKFSQIHVQPSSLGAIAWDICIKVPVSIRNCLPFNLIVQTTEIQSSVSKKDENGRSKHFVQYQTKPTESTIQKQSRKYFHNFNLEDSVVFNFLMNVPSNARSEFPFQLDFTQFSLTKDQYKDSTHEIELKDVENLEKIIILAKVRTTDQCDAEIIFFCKNLIINNSDQKIFYRQFEQKKLLPCQTDQNYQVIPICNSITKVIAQIDASDQKKKHFSTPFHINIAGPSNQINIQKMPYMYYPYIINTEASLVAPDLSLYMNVTTINPQYILSNNTDNTILVSQLGFQEKKVEVIPSKYRLVWYWQDPKSKLEIVFKYTPKHDQDNFDQSAYKWSKSIKPQRPGRISILCLNEANQDDNKKIRITKQICSQTSSTYIVFEEEDHKSPSFKIKNKSFDIEIECYQAFVQKVPQIIKQQESQTFSWLEPEMNKKQKQLLEVVLRKKTQENGISEVISKQQIDFEKINQKIQIFDISQKYLDSTNQTNISIDDLDQSTNKSNKKRKEKQKVIKTIDRAQEKKIYLEVKTKGFTKCLVLSVIFDRNKEKGDFNITHNKKGISNDIQEDDYSFTKESTLHVTIPQTVISFIALSEQQKTRREFLLAESINTEFIVINNPRNTEIQFKIQDFQIDNNCAFNEQQIYPKFLYPKEPLLDKRTDFFNLNVIIKKSESQLLHLQTVQFLLQSFVLQADELLVTWIYKFVHNLTINLDTNITNLHIALESEEQVQIINSQGNYSMQQTSIIDKSDMNFQERDYDEENFNKNDNNDFFQIGNQGWGKKTIGMLVDEDWNTEMVKRGRTLYFKTAIESKIRFLTNYNKLKITNNWYQKKLDIVQNAIFIEQIKINPIEIEISFLAGLRDQQDVGMKFEKHISQNFFKIASFEESIFKLNKFETSNFYGSRENFLATIKNIYFDSITTNVLSIFVSNLFGLNLLVFDIAQGTKDLFYKPIEGFIEGPLEGGRGIALGIKSFLGNGFGGGFSFGARVIQSPSYWILKFANDDDYVERREEWNFQKARDPLQGLKQGGKNALMGMASGLAGIVQKPYQGAKKEGFKGFAKGTAKGVTGVISKPVSGILDIFSKTLEGTGNWLKSNKRSQKKNMTTNQMLLEQSKMITGEIFNETQSNSQNQTMNQSQIVDLSQSVNLGNSAIKQKKKVNKKDYLNKIRMFRPFYGKFQRIKSYHQFQAFVAVNLKFIYNQQYENDRFLDVVAYIKDNASYCLILTEERILIIDASTKQRVVDYQRDSLHSVYIRELFASKQDNLTSSRYSGSILSDQIEQEQICIGYEVVVRISQSFDQLLSEQQSIKNIQTLQQREETLKNITEVSKLLNISSHNSLSSRSFSQSWSISNFQNKSLIKDGVTIPITDLWRAEDLQTKLQNYLVYVKKY